MIINEYDFLSISERLLKDGICQSMRAATVTASYAIQWKHGTTFDFKKSAVQMHRSRLRCIGIDIGVAA